MSLSSSSVGLYLAASKLRAGKSTFADEQKREEEEYNTVDTHVGLVIVFACLLWEIEEVSSLRFKQTTNKSILTEGNKERG